MNKKHADAAGKALSQNKTAGVDGSSRFRDDVRKEYPRKLALPLLGAAAGGILGELIWGFWSLGLFPGLVLGCAAQLAFAFSTRSRKNLPEQAA